MKLSEIKLSSSINKNIKEYCGEQIGSGCYRDVYEMKNNSRYVIKIERDPSKGAFTNACEWRNFINYLDCKFITEWMAPCHLINETGQVMIQSRARLKNKSEYPKKVLSIFTDLKIENFGWIGNRFVCFDYPLLIVNPGKGRYRNAKWWSIKGRK